jgi:hypothetical protein
MINKNQYFMMWFSFIIIIFLFLISGAYADDFKDKNASSVTKYDLELMHEFDNLAYDLSDVKLKSLNINKIYSFIIKYKSYIIDYNLLTIDFKVGREHRKYGTKEELMASRIEHMKKINELRKLDTERKILNCINGMFKDDYIKPSGKWNIAKICKDTGLHRNTVYKYITLENI